MVAHGSDESKQCVNEALVDGFFAGAKAAVVSGGLYYMAMKHSHAFKYTFNASARTALVVMPIFYTAWLNVEQSMHACMERHAPEFVRIED